MNLEEAIEAAVRAVPAVLALYSTSVSGRLITISDSGVLVSLGVDASSPAPGTAAAVAAAVRQALPVDPERRVTVRISRVTATA